MAVYEYTGLDQAGKNTKGIIDAESPKAARLKLRRTGVFPTSLVEEKADKGERFFAGKEVSLKDIFERITIQDISIMTRQLGTLLKAGLPMVGALSAITDQIENEKLRKITSQVRERVNEGSSLAGALAEFPRVFSDLYVNMIAAGETSGALEIVLFRLADYTEGQVRIKNKVLGALAYPVIMVVIAVGVLAVLFTYVIPKVMEIFADLEQALPLPTVILITLSNFARSYWWVMAIALAGIIFGMRRYVQTEKGRYSWDKTILRVPIFGKIIRMTAVSRFTKTLSTLLASGIPLLNCLDIVRNIVNNAIVAEAVDTARESVTEGASLAEPLRRSKVFPPIVVHMIASGEQSGELEGMLEKVSEFYDNEVDTKVTSLTTLLEPIMILVMALIVAFIVVSILLPLLEMNQIVAR